MSLEIALIRAELRYLHRIYDATELHYFRARGLARKRYSDYLDELHARIAIKEQPLLHP